MFWKSKIKESYDNLNVSNKNIGRSNLGLTVAVVFLTLMVMNKETEIIVMPNDFKEPIIMNGNQITQEYKIQWGLMIATILGNVTPKNSKFVIDRITKMVPLELNPDEAEALMVSTIEEMTLRGVSEKFVPSDAIYSSITDYVWVVGEKTTTSLKTGAADSGSYTYELKIGVRNGSPMILDIQQYPHAVNPALRERELLQSKNSKASIDNDTVVKFKAG
ncbi:type IV conjugative transfer system protein TraE [Shewanella sp. SM101]|jgi:conjugal transfer pilus assembly protein TraE|uniref:TraE/TraK family type IV conjugative transfer system protein n=1 Tax=Shewanella TaxID=22 RepID=UPI0002112D8D|nr:MULTISPECIES: TraE/TraK family type IV conjugative transfer system protein [Shewanella]AEH16228.1 hypothetical protein Sbal117_4590 [Shewanella baltica OS117]MCU8008951.1 type IV conjugative transfer system protein TraE [Shewanella sp. SM87]MCU8106902.1 type IV conjugative transfer system protein TraE [Shewanella sp. SM101]